MNKQVCNMFSNINNGQLAHKTFVLQKKKNNCEQILNVLWDEGFILGYKKLKETPNELKIFLKYHKGKPVINSTKIISKPSLRVYYSLKELWKLKSSQGVVLVSTSQGIMSDLKCREKKLGGEPLISIK